MYPAEISSKPRLRVALIGGGKMGLHHLKAIRATGLADIVGVADPVAPGAELRAQLGPGAAITSTAAELFATARPDLVHIVTPPSSHVELAIQAIEAGCHTYVEKPFTDTAADARRVLDLAAARGLSVCAGHQVMFEPSSLALRAALRGIGRVTHVESYFAFRMVRRTITRVAQTKDILPHAVYPVVEHLRSSAGTDHAPIQFAGLTVDASGEVYAMLRCGQATAIVVVTLNGRPVEQYLEVVGTNGSLRADSGYAAATELLGHGAGAGVLLTPYRRAWQTAKGATRGFARRFLTSDGSYPGLRELLERYYTSVLTGSAPPLSPQSILDTVDVCERIGRELDAAEEAQEATARIRLVHAEFALPTPVKRGVVLVTGGTGLLGRRVVEEIRGAGFPVRAVARRVPPYSARVPGVEYVSGDLARGLGDDIMRGTSMVVHCAAETSGGQAEHQRNSVDATRLLIEAAARAGVKAMVHVSSLAVLKTSREMGRAIDEDTPVDPNSLSRGPYVWGKAESELLAQQLGSSLGVEVKIVRPGPIVDYDSFDPPGRLGREAGALFVAIGPRTGTLSVCDVSTAARVLRSYVEAFELVPPRLNLVESPPPTRKALVERLRRGRPELRVLWVPAWALRLLSGPLKLLQRYALGSAQPMDVAAAFASERYKTDLAARTIERAGRAVARDVA